MQWKLGDRGKGVQYVQEWLALNSPVGVVVDHKFGAATQEAVRIFQRHVGLPATGVVDDATWDLLIKPQNDATAAVRRPADGRLSTAVLACAERHLNANSREVGDNNCGPWVRLYMNGKEGERMKWCSGFATYCLHQAAASLGVAAPLRRQTSVPLLVAAARRAGRLRLHPSAQQRSEIRPGDLFVVRGGKFGWHHVGIVATIGDDTFTSIEGNSNDDVQAKSYEVCRRVRSYEFPVKDFIRVD